MPIKESHKDNDLCASLDYEAEYHRLCAELEKMKEENCYLREELKQKNTDMSWLYGFKQAIETVFDWGNKP